MTGGVDDALAANAPCSDHFAFELGHTVHACGVPAVLKGQGLICRMRAVGSCADNAVVEVFFGMLKCERVNRRCYVTRAEARVDLFDDIELFYNPRRRRQLAQTTGSSLIKPSVEMG